MSDKYQPSNGTEGDWFCSQWCEKCARDAWMNGTSTVDEASDNDELCDILVRTMAYSLNDKEYPDEWIRDKDSGPRCTAFIPVGEEVPRPRCTKTEDMFGEVGK